MLNIDVTRLVPLAFAPRPLPLSERLYCQLPAVRRSI